MRGILPKNIGFYVANLPTAEYNEVRDLANNAKIEETFIKENPNHPDIKIHQENFANYINRINKLTLKGIEYKQQSDIEYQKRLTEEAEAKLRTEAEEMAGRERFKTFLRESQRKAQIEQSEILSSTQKTQELISYIKPIGIATGIIGLGIAGIGTLAAIGYMAKKSMEEEKEKPKEEK